MALPFARFYRLGVPEQALGGIPLGFGIVVEDKPSELMNFHVYRSVLQWVGEDWTNWCHSDHHE